MARGDPAPDRRTFDIRAGLEIDGQQRPRTTAISGAVAERIRLLQARSTTLIVAEHFGADAAVGVDFEQEGVAEAAVDDVDFADAFIEGFEAAFDFGDHAAFDRAFADQFAGLGGGERMDERFRIVLFHADAVDITEEDQLFSAERGGDGGGGGVGIDVEFAAVGGEAHGGDDGDLAGVAEVFDRGAVDAGDTADVAEVDLAAGVIFQCGLLAEQDVGRAEVERHGAAAEIFDLFGDLLAGFVGQNFLDDFERGVVGIAAALDESRDQPGGIHGATDGRATAVNDDRPHADAFHEDDVDEQMPQGVGIFHHAAAELDDGDLIAEAADPAEGFDQHVGFFDRVLVVFFDGHRQRVQGSGFRS